MLFRAAPVYRVISETGPDHEKFFVTEIIIGGKVLGKGEGRSKKQSEQDAAKKAHPALLEPVMRVEVVVPEEYMGDVIGDITSRRGHIQSMEVRGGSQVINSRVPLSEMFGYATDLRSSTQGRGSYSMHFDRYEPTPASVSEEVIAKVQGR